MTATVLSPLRSSVSIFTRTREYMRISRKTGAEMESLKSHWASEILSSLNIELKVLGRASSAGPVILVGNHLSYLDIPLLMANVRGLSFVAKAELKRWPVFGRGAVLLGTTFVERTSDGSRASAKAAIEETLKQGRKVALFPSGTTCVSESREWRHGAFEIAHRLGIPIQPFRIRYSPLRTAAYIDNDFFPLHLFRLAKVGAVKASLELHASVAVEDVIDCSQRWRSWAKEGLE